MEIIDNDKSIKVGSISSELKCTISIKNNDFYVFLGSGGLLGASEAYAAGLWECNDLVALTQIMVRNQKLMSNLDSGFAKFLVPINKLYTLHKEKYNLGK